MKDICKFVKMMPFFDLFYFLKNNLHLHEVYGILKCSKHIVLLMSKIFIISVLISNMIKFKNSEKILT